MRELPRVLGVLGVVCLTGNLGTNKLDLEWPMAENMKSGEALSSWRVHQGYNYPRTWTFVLHLAKEEGDSRNSGRRIVCSSSRRRWSKAILRRVSARSFALPGLRQ